MPRFAAPLLLLVACTPAVAEAQDFEKLYAATVPATAWVVTPRGDDFASAAGVVIDAKRRLMLTSYHVVAGDDKPLALFPKFDKGRLLAEKDTNLERVRNNESSGFKVLATDPKRDLALVRVDTLPEGVTTVAIAEKAPGPGARVFSVGSPSASDALWVYAPGDVRQVYRKRFTTTAGELKIDIDCEVIETSSPVGPGDSGGPLVDASGRLVGITQGGRAGVVGFAYFISVGEIRGFLKENKIDLPPARD